jgi:hypothetical protein
MYFGLLEICEGREEISIAVYKHILHVDFLSIIIHLILFHSSAILV